MKLILIVFLISFSLYSKEKGQTEITTEDGIEVFQSEKYYLLKKNVIINSDDFVLTADLVKAFFEKDLYDVTNIESQGNVKLKSTKGMTASGQKLNFSTINNEMTVMGENSILNMENLQMNSDELIEINDTNKTFYLQGDNSKLKSKDLLIIGSLIKGQYDEFNGTNEVTNLDVESKTLIRIQTDKLDMYSLKAIYNKKENLIELFDKVKIIRDNEIIIGDYAKINTLTESYKVTSKESGKVKVLLDKTDE